MIKYSVIVPFHSNPNLLTMCIASLVKVLDPFESEIIIIDNNANGSQLPHDIRHNTHCHVISCQENLMYPRAINKGAEYANGKYLVFCDADTCVTQNFHKFLTNELVSSEVGFSSAMLLNMHSETIQEFGITSSLYNYPHPYAGRKVGFELITNNHLSLAACAACSTIKRDLFISVGGFDEMLLHSYSDIDLCLRLNKKGYKTLCVANAIAYHLGSSTFGSGMSTNLKEDTKAIFASKHPCIPIGITKYLDASCELFLNKYRISSKDYFVLNTSTIGNPELYIDHVIQNLQVKETMRLTYPYRQRDASFVDYLNFIPYMIRNYRVPILYFVDNFRSFINNRLWQSCRSEYDDIVVDRHANIELLRML